MWQLALYGVAYLATVFFVARLINRKKGKNQRRDDDDGGGLLVEFNPVLDLPPGVTLPDGSGGTPVEETEEEPVLA